MLLSYCFGKLMWMSVVSERGFLCSAALRFENKELFVIQLTSIEIQFIISFSPVVASVSTHMSHISL